MTITAIKLWIKEKWYYIVSLSVLIGFAIFAALRKHPNPSAVSDAAEAQLQQKLAEARTQAAVEIGRAQGREEEVQKQVDQIAQMPAISTDDRQKQLQALADLVNSTRRKR